MSLQAKPGLDESEVLMDLFSHAYRCLGHWDTHSLLQVGMLCTTYTVESQRYTHLFHNPYYLPYTFKLSTPFCHVPTHLPIPLSHCFLPRDLELCVLQKNLWACLPTLLTPLHIHTGRPLHRHVSPRSHTLNTTLSPIIPYTSSLSISNHERHFSVRLVLKGNVFADSQAGEPFGSLNHLWQVLWLRPLE